MICSEARIPTAHAGAYFATLADRLTDGAVGGDGREGEARHEAHFDLKGGHCDLQSDSERLVIACSAEEAEVVRELCALVEQNFPAQQAGDAIVFTWHTVEL